MFIEKINENQIRCRLTQAELDERKLKVSELAYGGDKARELLEEMMDHAQRELDFHVEKGNPLMIEASANGLGVILTITKVDDENKSSEGDLSKTRNQVFPKKLPKPLEDMMLSDEFLNKLKNMSNEAKQKEKEDTQKITSRIYSFVSFNDLLKAARAMKGLKIGYTTLYKNKRTGEYILATHRGDMDIKTYVKFGNMLSEYAMQVKADGPSLAFLEEHCDVVIYDNVLETLAKM